MAASRVMTYNIKYDTDVESGARWTAGRRAAVAAMIRRAGADVIGLQEAFAHQLTDLLTDLPQYAAAGVGRDDGAAAGEFAPVLWRTDRWRALDSGTFWLSNTPEAPSRYPSAHCTRICTWAALAPLGQAAPAAAPLRVWNVHLDNGSEEARRFGIDVVLERIAARDLAGTEPGALDVLLGDFNAGPDSAPVRAATARLRNAREAAVTAPTGPGATFHDWHPESIADLGPEDPLRIDHVFVGPGATVLAYDVPTPQEPGGMIPSDHHPVVVVVDPHPRRAGG